MHTRTGGQIDHEEPVEGRQPSGGPDLSREEVGGSTFAPRGLDDWGPRRRALRSRLDTFARQDPRDGCPPHLVAEFADRALDPGVAPDRVLPGEPHDEYAEFAHYPGTPGCAAPVPPPGCDQLQLPAHDRVWRDDRRHSAKQAPPELLTLRRKTAPLVVRQVQTTTAELLLEDAVLLDQAFDRLLLLPVDPSGDGQDERAQWKAVGQHPIMSSVLTVPSPRRRTVGTVRARVRRVLKSW